LRKTIPLCVYDDDNKEDVAEFDGDDPYDSLRYHTKAIDNYNFTNLQSKSKHLMKIAAVVAEFQKNQDWTSFHRKLEVLEKKKIYAVTPIRSRRRASGRIYH
jgi:hypothetical protein